jgi:hypothetical protein
MNCYRLGAQAHCVAGGLYQRCRAAVSRRPLPTAPRLAHADLPGSKVRAAAPMRGIAAEVGDGGSTWYPPPGQLWNGEWVPPHWGANHHYGVWARYGGPAVPTHWVWGPSGGACDYPFADWRSPTGGWGNP